MITTILLDVGGVILDETEHEKLREEIITGLISKHKKSYSRTMYTYDINKAVSGYAPNVYGYVIWKNTGKPDLYHKLKEEYKKTFHMINPPLKLMHGFAEMVRKLASSYRINIAGQYGKKILELLETEGLLKYFETEFTQDDFDITKPDPRYYERILKKLDRIPEECIMIGDRIDKDVIPAKQVGMKTIRMRTGLHLKQEPRLLEEYPDEEVYSLVEIPEKIEKIKKGF